MNRNFSVGFGGEAIAVEGDPVRRPGPVVGTPPGLPATIAAMLGITESSAAERLGLLVDATRVVR
ncbi:MAG: hypothetical protein AAGA56_31590 [Myxococcota bacterium]